MGDYFLTDDVQVGAPIKDLVVSYDNPVRSASGYLLDVDAHLSFPPIHEPDDAPPQSRSDTYAVLRKHNHVVTIPMRRWAGNGPVFSHSDLELSAQ